MKQIALFSFSILLLHAQTFSQPYSILQSPPQSSAQSIADKVKHGEFGMRWCGSDKSGQNTWDLAFFYHKEQVSLAVQFAGQFPEQLAHEKTKFAHAVDNGKQIWTYIHGTLPDHVEMGTQKASASTDQVMDRQAQPLVVYGGKPQSITVAQLSAFAQNKKVVIYTGAGLSADCVPTMVQLMNQLGMNNDFRTFQDCVPVLKKAVTAPQDFIQPMAAFYRACFYGKPSAAHDAITKMVERKNWGLITENIDMLHQRSGVEPLTHDQGWLKNNVASTDLQKIDAIITVGLGMDESGFLAWYKQHNPHGVIVALNLAQPKYLGDNDFLVVGDVQTVLPELCEELEK